MKKLFTFFLILVILVIVSGGCSSNVTFEETNTTDIVSVLRTDPENETAETTVFTTEATEVYSIEREEPVAASKTTEIITEYIPETTTAAIVTTTTASTAPANNYSFASSSQLEMLKKVNEYRRANGIGELTLDEDLCRAAAVRAREAAKYWSHTRPDGSKAHTVITECGMKGCNGYGENLASNMKAKNGDTVVDRAMINWKNSPSHNKNLLDNDWKCVGFGFYTDAEGYTFIAQVFVMEVYR